MTKLIFMGTPDFSATVLKGLLADSRYEILAVVTQPDRKVRSQKEIRMTPVKQVALEHQLPVFSRRNYRVVRNGNSLIPRCRWNCDRCFWTILPTKLLENFQFAVNVHASLFA